jgi:hypothetical protein
VEDNTTQQIPKIVSASPIEKIISVLQKDARFTKQVSNSNSEIVLEIQLFCYKAELTAV